MKKLLLVLFILVLLAIIGFGIFLATFDADRYRPFIIDKIQSAIGNPVELEHISLGWHGGLALDIKNLAVYTGPEVKGKPAIELESASAIVRLMPLLRSNIQATSILLDGLRVHVIRGVDGKIRVVGIASHPKKENNAAQALPLLIDLIKLEHGEIRFTDNSVEPSMDITIKELDFKLKNVNLLRPIEIQARMAIAGNKQNVELSGKIHLKQPDGGTLLENVRLETDFNRMKTADLLRIIPALRQTGLQEGLEGNLSVDLNRFEIGGEGVREVTGDVRLTHGRIILDGLKNPVEQVSLEGTGAKDRFEFRNFSAAIAGGKVTAKGIVEQLATHPQFKLDAKLEEISLDQILPASGSHEPQLKGRLSAAFQGTAQGKNWPVISQTLSGEGRLILQDGVVMNLNVLQEVFHRMSVLPGLVETLLERLPESYKEKLSRRDTILEPIDIPMAVERGSILFNNFRLATDSFETTGGGNLRFDGTLSAQAMLIIDPDLSKAMIRSVEELQYLADRDGRMQLPVNVSGVLPRVGVMPDLQYIGSRLATAKASEFIGQLFRKPGEKKETTVPVDNTQTSAPQDQQMTQAPPENPYQQLLGGLLQQALQKKKSPSSSQDQPASSG